LKGMLVEFASAVEPAPIAAGRHQWRRKTT
jgi:hypothetical protein